MFCQWVNNGRRGPPRTPWILEHPRTTGMMQSLRQRGFGCPGLYCMVKWCVHLFRTLFKILSRSLGATPYRPGAGGKQNVGQDPESNRYLLTLFYFIDNERSIFILLISLFYCYNTI
jgi:hypothetical protein